MGIGENLPETTGDSGGVIIGGGFSSAIVDFEESTPSKK